VVNGSSEEAFSEEDLAQILAPIALYPDSVLSHILIAATYPLEVVQAERWVTRNPDLSPEDALDKTEDKQWDPSVKALVQFPELLERLSDNLEWTRNLGDAFLQDEERLLASIQTLRHQADNAGSFDDVEEMTVVHEDGNIIIQPIETEVIYIPYYDTRTAFGSWRWHDHPPTYWERNWRGRHNYYSIRHHNVFSWHPFDHLAASFLFGNFHWTNRHIVVNDYHFLHNRSKHKSHRYGNFDKSYTKRWFHNSHHRRGVGYRHRDKKGHFRNDDSRPNRHYGSHKNNAQKAKNWKHRSNNIEKGNKHRFGSTNTLNRHTGKSGVNSKSHRKEKLGHKKQAPKIGYKQAIRNAQKQESATARHFSKRQKTTTAPIHEQKRSAKAKRSNRGANSSYAINNNSNAKNNQHRKMKKQTHGRRHRGEER